MPLVAHVSYPPFAERREFELGPSGARLQFQVPIATPGGELGYGIEFPSGRALHLDARTIYPAGETVEIALDRNEYRPGETVTVAATLRQAGTLELVGFDRSVSLDGSGVIVFPIPAGLPFGRYPIAWTFYAGEPAPGVLNGDVFVKVRGPWVRIPQMRVTSDGTDAHPHGDSNLRHRDLRHRPRVGCRPNRRAGAYGGAVGDCRGRWRDYGRTAASSRAH